MKITKFKNQITHELLECGNINDVKVIDGIEYLSVNKPGNTRQLLMRKDVLNKVVDKK